MAEAGCRMRWGLPEIRDEDHLAEWMGVSLEHLRYLTYRGPDGEALHYQRYKVPKPNGKGVRSISAPSEELGRVQRWVLVNILEKVPVAAQAHGFVGGRSTVTNAEGHSGKAVVINMDLKDFFPSVKHGRVRGVFQGLGYRGPVAERLALLCTEPGRGSRHLPQGACTSPALTNVLCLSLDKVLTKAAAGRGFTYTRYADDLTFSGDDPSGVSGMIGEVRFLVGAAGFRENKAKLKVMGRKGRQEVTGVVVNVCPTIGRAERRQLRSILFNAERHGLEAANRENLPEFRSWLAGRVGYACMVEPRRAAWWRERLGAAVGGRDARCLVGVGVEFGVAGDPAQAFDEDPSRQRTVPLAECALVGGTGWDGLEGGGDFLEGWERPAVRRPRALPDPRQSAW